MLKFRRGLDDKERAFKDAGIFGNLTRLDIFRDARHILLYYPFDGEPDTIRIIEKFIGEKNLYLPVIKGESHFQAVPISNPLELKKNRYGIPEPVNTDPNSIYDDKIELIITPGVAFDKKGNRIGMGKGFYDRYFEAYDKPVKVAIAFEEQILEMVPANENDRHVDIIVTDRNIYVCD